MKMKKKPEDKNKQTVDEIHSSRDSLKHNPNVNREIARKSVQKLLLTDKEKIDSGKYEWVIITPQYGKPYKSLKKKTNE